jgi:hypothetical protein
MELSSSVDWIVYFDMALQNHSRDRCWDACGDGSVVDGLGARGDERRKGCTNKMSEKSIAMAAEIYCWW